MCIKSFKNSTSKILYKYNISGTEWYKYPQTSACVKNTRSVEKCCDMHVHMYLEYNLVIKM